MNTEVDDAPTKLTYEMYGMKFTAEFPSSDDVDIDDVMSAFYGLMTAASWHPDTVINGMAEFARTHQISLADQIKESMKNAE